MSSSLSVAVGVIWLPSCGPVSGFWRFFVYYGGGFSLCLTLRYDHQRRLGLFRLDDARTSGRKTLWATGGVDS